MVDIIVHISGNILGKLYQIGHDGLASSGYSQDEQFCITKALEEFIQKYTQKGVYE